MGGDEVRDGVTLTNLGQPLFEGRRRPSGTWWNTWTRSATAIIPVLRDRPLSVIRVLRGQAPFMQKNVPKYTPPWVPTVSLWAEASRREVTYALCNDRRTLLWFANQRAVEFHPALVRADHWGHPTHLILDIDPPEGEAFGLAVQAAQLVRQALADAGMAGAVKTSGAKGLHVFVPLDAGGGHRGRGRGHPALAARAERLDPGAGHHGLHPGGPRRQGVPGRDPGRRGDGGGGLQPADPARRAGVVPGGLG